MMMTMTMTMMTTIMMLMVLYVVEQVLASQEYILLPVQMDKVVQLYETMMTRHTTMIVGPTGGGKSVVLNTLAAAQTRMGIATRLYTINPKERSVVELYGVLDPNTRNWTDGLLSNIFRDINKPTDKNERKYIVYDGDVDALWVGAPRPIFYGIFRAAQCLPFPPLSSTLPSFPSSPSP